MLQQQHCCSKPDFGCWQPVAVSIFAVTRLVAVNPKYNTPSKSERMYQTYFDPFRGGGALQFSREVNVGVMFSLSCTCTLVSMAVTRMCSSSCQQHFALVGSAAVQVTRLSSGLAVR
jgi:hypothetical protein